MLLFEGTSKAEVKRRRRGAAGQEVALWTSLEAAQAAGTERILVVDVEGLAGPLVEVAAGMQVVAASVPPAAVRNLDPYLPPRSVAAAGGYVVRAGAAEPEVLLIFRRGVWDLPKGKRDPGEDLAACALREVREEVGIQTLHLGPPLGTTVHGYPERRRYAIKTTHWFLMHTPETSFTPEAREGIEAVAWMPWSIAIARIGYDTLRRQMERLAPEVRAAQAPGVPTASPNLSGNP